MTCRFTSSSCSPPSNLLPLRLQCNHTLLHSGAFSDRVFPRNWFARLRRQKDMIRLISHVSKGSDFFASTGDDELYEVLPDGRISYLDEQDVVTFIDPPKELIPLEPGSYNPAAYLWKKIGDITEGRRQRLLSLLNKWLIPKVWQLSGARFQDDKLMKKSASALLALGTNQIEPEFWNCRTNSGPLPFPSLNDFRMVIFQGIDGGTYGRIIYGASYLSALANSFCPLYFTVKEINEVMSTEQPCDLAYEFGDGLLCLPSYPDGFPQPVKHPWPFNDHLVIYIRHVGPGVLVGQAWLEGRKLDQVPKKFCGEILMVKEYMTL